ncbi:MAG: hypothetical protein J0H56_12540 [Micrococcales bacterium]|nr:hypothetical protein [Micrococcales bacterium]
MGVTVQVRDLDADVQERLRKAAAQEGLSLSAFLRRELTELARDLEVRERAGQETTLQAMLGGPLPGLDHISTLEIVDIIHEGRSERL